MERRAHCSMTGWAFSSEHADMAFWDVNTHHLAVQGVTDFKRTRLKIGPIMAEIIHVYLPTFVPNPRHQPSGTCPMN